MWKVEVQTVGDPKWYSNGVRHDTEEQARKAGSDLFMAWTACVEWRVVETDEKDFTTLIKEK